MTVVHIDFETRATVDLKKAGLYRYVEDPATSIICMSYRLDDGPVKNWRPPAPVPDDLICAIAAGAEVRAHNAAFERTIWNAKVPTSLRLTPEQMDCTMARAAAVNLPQALFALANAIGVPDGKDMDGHALMMKMCRPKSRDPLTWYEDPKDVARLAAYCDQDVRTEAEVDRRLPRLKPRERRIWELDQTINDRGVQIDVQMAGAAYAAIEEALKRANARMSDLTGGAVSSVTQTARIVNWIKVQGIPCYSVAEDEHEELIIGAEVFDRPAVEQVIDLRARSAKASKFGAMLTQVCNDGRVRGSLRYSSTIQRRWVGAGVQFQNMKRVETEEDAVDVALAIKVFKSWRSPSDVVDRLELLFDAPLDILSLCTRGSIIAKPGCHLIGGDYSSIESRVNAWLSGEEWKLKAFEEIDAGKGVNIYLFTAARMYGLDVSTLTKQSVEYVTGKMSELAFGFAGGAGAQQRIALKNGVRIPHKDAEHNKFSWRMENPSIVEFWSELENAAIEAVSNRGTVIPVAGGRIAYVADKKFLYCRLPSGGVIHYPSPSVGWKSKTIVIDGDEVELNRVTVSFWAQHNGRWSQQDLYGGVQCAHVVSGTARDILCESMLAAEEAGYPIVLTIHDELLCELPQGQGSADDLKAIMLRPIEWMGDCPIAASTWEGDRYTK